MRCRSTVLHMGMVCCTSLRPTAFGEACRWNSECVHLLFQLPASTVLCVAAMAADNLATASHRACAPLAPQVTHLAGPDLRLREAASGRCAHTRAAASPRGPKAQAAARTATPGPYTAVAAPGERRSVRLAAGYHRRPVAVCRRLYPAAAAHHHWAGRPQGAWR